MEQLEYTNRLGYNSYKWDYAVRQHGTDVLPLTVADMDFKAPQCVRQVMKDYIDMGAIGYTYASESYQDSFMNWEKDVHGVELEREWLRFAPGVVTAFSWLISECFKPGDRCIVLTPVYGPILQIPEACGLTVVRSDLREEGGIYTIDFDDFEQKIIDNEVKLLLLCSPHNPVGRVWTAEELDRLVSICEAHDVFIIADEIHQDIIHTGHEHVSILRAARDLDKVVMLTSPAKTFNIAGAENSFMAIPSEEVRAKIDRLQDRIACHSGNSLGHVATEAAYSGGGEWLALVKAQVMDNYRMASEILRRGLPDIVISPLEGTFLMWCDFDAYVAEGETAADVILEKSNVMLSSGDAFGGDKYRSWVRICLATSAANVREAMNRIVECMK